MVYKDTTIDLLLIMPTYLAYIQLPIYSQLKHQILEHKQSSLLKSNQPLRPEAIPEKDKLGQGEDHS